MSFRSVEESMRLPPGERAPGIVGVLAASFPEPIEPRLLWRNILGGQTWALGDRVVKWSPRSAGIELAREATALRFLAGRHPVPRLLATGDDAEGQWIVTAAIDADTAVADRWRADPARAVAAIAEGLRRLHALPIDEVPALGSWATRAPASLGPRPQVDDPVVVHGDACAPNTLLTADGRFAAHVDLGALAVGDRFADLAIAARSLAWNYGPGWDSQFYAAYGTAPDQERAAYYEALSDLES